MPDPVPPRTGRRCGPAAAILLATFLVGTGAAGAESPAPPEKELPSLASLGIKGTVSFKNFSHFRETPDDNRNFREEGILQLEWARRLASWSSVKIVAEAREDDDRFARGFTFQVPETSKHRSLLNLKEVVASFPLGPVEVTLGKQIFAWGTADAYNPTDNINPYDYLDVLDNEKMGVYSAAARLTAGPASLTFAVVPFFTPSRTPFSKNRWTPPPPAGLIAIVDNREVPSRDADNMQYAARLKTTLQGWDLSASYYEGFEHTPAIRRSTVLVPPGLPVPRFTPVFTRIRAAGFDFSTTVRKFEFHGEGVFKFAERNGRDDRFQGISGLNYTWDELGLKWLEQITFIVEHARETILSHERHSPIVEAGGSPEVGDLLANNAFRDALVGRILFKFSEETQLKLTGTMDFTQNPNHYLQLKLTHKLTDALHVESGLDFMAGDRDTFWGRWKDNDRFFFFLKYFF